MEFYRDPLMWYLISVIISVFLTLVAAVSVPGRTKTVRGNFLEAALAVSFVPGLNLLLIAINLVGLISEAIKAFNDRRL
jgi:hypothetical protein